MKLSIIIPCYNSARFIAKTLDMLISQGLSDCEVIVVNDGSEDETASIVQNYEKKNPSIFFIDKEHTGVSATRNLGLKNAHGEYILFLDSDDYYVQNGLSIIKEHLERNKPDVLTCGFIKKGERTSIIYSDKNKNGLYDTDSFLRLFLLRDIHFCVGTFVCRKKLLIDNSITFDESLRIGEDFDFFFKVLKQAKKNEYLANPILYYVLHETSTMQGYHKFSYDVFKSFIINYQNALECQKEFDTLKKECNFYIKNSYVAQLLLYLRSKTSDEKINNGFKTYKNVLETKSVFRLKKSLLFGLFRVFPMSFILQFFNKIEKK